ncbi:hypothetical protein QR98_0013740 [Sarcoptes scabiei]|uniref:Uncharacterized protein n=1 Tax=Sarcoptes scabiei TaxID=52283 RepID=A0A131ZVS4_SARSC|nr:hypothetical protein QR98_0013740 [Sarcoptes scabiei]
MSIEQETEQANLLARVNFPIYCVKAITERHILIGGGGGCSKTGIANNLEIYELIYDHHTNTARATLATHFDVDAFFESRRWSCDNEHVYHSYCFEIFIRFTLWWDGRNVLCL